jgi:uncharacterized membrane protein
LTKEQKIFGTPLKIALAAISTALVSVATIAFSVYVPQTHGFFNVGETMVFTTAILFGPLIGGFAGGVGSMMADILLGYPYYAPATLIIKGAEGGIVGYLSRKKPSFSKNSWKIFTFLIGSVIGLSLSIIGIVFYSGEVEFALGTLSTVLTIPLTFWYLIGAIIIISTTFVGLKVEPEIGWLVFSILVGGSAMVTGYFLFQQFLLFPLFGIEVLAFAEIPINIGQMLVGLVIAVPIIKIIKRTFPNLNMRNTAN